MRNGTLDYARLIAAAGVVVFHSKAPGAWIGLAGLYFFLLILPFLGLKSLWSKTASRLAFPDYAARKAWRLLLPWFGWGLIYASLKVAEILLTDRSFQTEFAFWMLVNGPSVHLWFLPFAFCVSLALWPFRHHAKLADGSDLTTVFTILLLCVGLAVFYSVMPPAAYFGLPFSPWLVSLPTVALGAVFAILPRLRDQAFVMLAVTLCMPLLGWPSSSVQMVLAGWIVLACLALPLPETALSRRAANLSLTVYLLHILVLSIFERLIYFPRGSIALAAVVLLVTGLLAAMRYGIAKRMRPSGLLWQFLGVDVR